MDKKRKSALQEDRKREQNHDLGMYSYQLVLFSNENSDGLLNIECVPHEWLDFNEETHTCVSKYMPPPYTKIKTALLTKMIKEKDDPDENWPTYPIEIRGQAETYADALEKLKVLRKEQYAFTSEPDTSKAEKSQRLHKILERKRLGKSHTDTLTQFPDSSSSGTEVEFPVDSPIESDIEKFGEMSSDENQNVATATNRNPHRVAHRSNIYSAKLAVKDQNTSTLKKRNDKKISNRESILPKFHKQSTKPSSSKSSKAAAPEESDIEKFGEISSDENQNLSTATNRNRNDKKISNRENIPPKYHEKSRKPPFSKSSKVADLANRKSIPVLEERTKSKSYLSRERIEKEKNTEGITAKPKNMHDPEESYKANYRDNIHEVLNPGRSISKSLHNPSVTSNDLPAPSTSSNKDFQQLQDNYESMRYDINKMRKDISTIKDLLTQVLENVPGLTYLSFDDKYPQNIPFKTMAAFKDFDIELTNDKELRKEFIQSLQMAINSTESISKVIVNILKKWLSKDVAMEFTAVKAIGEKIVMKDTQFCKCILKAFEMKMAADPELAVLSEKHFYDKLGAVLGNARDWMGQRTTERSKTTRNAEAT